MRLLIWAEDIERINPQIPVDLVVDHSVITDASGNQDSFNLNLELEYERNAERYRFVRWAQQAFDNFRVVPPASGIVHQVNLEHLGTSVMTSEQNGVTEVFLDTLVGTDSHTPMINGLGTIGWGVGGIEAEAAMLGQALYFVIPEVVGIKLVGKMPEGSTATDLALTVTSLLRKRGVVGKIVEFFRTFAETNYVGRPCDNREYGTRIRRDDVLFPNGRCGDGLFKVDGKRKVCQSFQSVSRSTGNVSARTIHQIQNSRMY